VHPPFPSQGNQAKPSASSLRKDTHFTHPLPTKAKASLACCSPCHATICHERFSDGVHPDLLAANDTHTPNDKRKLFWRSAPWHGLPLWAMTGLVVFALSNDGKTKHELSWLNWPSLVFLALARLAFLHQTLASMMPWPMGQK
jgi:hypothetical protein